MSDIRKRSEEELMSLLLSMRSELFTLKLKVSSSETRTAASGKVIRRSIARILTYLRLGDRGLKCLR